MINKYTFSDTTTSFLLYGQGLKNEPIKFQEEIFANLTEFNIDLLNRKEEHKLPILNIKDFYITLLNPKKRVNDKILIEQGIESFNDLLNAYHLLRINQLNKPLRIRQMVEKKYSEIINLEYSEMVSENSN